MYLPISAHRLENLLIYLDNSTRRKPFGVASSLRRPPWPSSIGAALAASLKRRHSPAVETASRPITAARMMRSTAVVEP